MRLQSLEIEHFRAVQSAQLQFGPALNIIHGANDRGKSTIAEAIRAALLITPGSAESRSDLLVHQCGFTPEAAIHAATQVSAMVVGQSSQRGTIAAGMAADLVVLSADPVAEIRNVRKIVEVIKDGKTFRSAQNP